MKSKNSAGGEDRAPMTGQVVYVYAFDLAYDMKRQPLETILSQPVREYTIWPSKRTPRHLFFYRPQMVDLPEVTRTGPRGEVAVQRSLKLFSVGAMSIQVRVPFRIERMEDLVSYHDLTFADGQSLADEVAELAEQARRELEPYCIRPVQQLTQVEAYTIFCLDSLPSKAGEPEISAEDWLVLNRRRVAGLLTQEEEPTYLSEQEAAESTGLYLSYYDSEIVVVDWDAALVVGEADALGDLLHIMELASVQLVELEAYDRVLDASLETAYRDLAKWRPGPANRQVRRNLGIIRVDLARLSDELVNITKFFGDWHIARIYGQLSHRLHLGDWHGIIDEKLKTLGDLYELLQRDRTNFWMTVLEATIVLLFILDLIILVVMGL